LVRTYREPFLCRKIAPHNLGGGLGLMRKSQYGHIFNGILISGCLQIAVSEVGRVDVASVKMIEIICLP